jgi:DNA-binding transcriptional ArsR family regulator
MLKPLRLAILERLAEPDSATGLSRELGLPRQRLNYHLRQLEGVGLVTCVEERRKGNCVERLFQATARHYLISPSALGAVAPPDPSSRAFDADRRSWSYLVTLLSKALRQLTQLRRGADRADKRLATVGLETRVRFASPAALAEFSERLAESVAELVAEFHRPETEEGPGGRSYELFLASYPTPLAEETSHD